LLGIEKVKTMMNRQGPYIKDVHKITKNYPIFLPCP